MAWKTIPLWYECGSHCIAPLKWPGLGSRHKKPNCKANGKSMLQKREPALGQNYVGTG